MNIHNDIFIATLKKRQNAIDFLEESLPDEILAVLDLSSLGYDDTSYVLEEYRELFSDLVLKVKTKDSESKMDVYLLMEHKSSRPDGNDLFLQLLSYMYAMYSEDRKNGRPFRQIVPLVFYHGAEKWSIPQSFRETVNPAPLFKKYTPDFSYILYDVSNYQTENDRNYQKNIMLYSTLTAMKYAFEQGDLTHIRRLFERLHEYGLLKDIIKIEMLIVYVTQTHDNNRNDIIEMINEIDKEGGLKMLTFADYFKTQGIEEGIEKGEHHKALKTAQNMLKDGIPAEKIVLYTGLSVKEIESIKE